MSELISIIIPVYNGEKSISTSINCVREQTYQDLEIIIVDDCSSDHSLEICRQFEREDTRIKVIHHDKNMGVSAARNTGLENAGGSYIGFMDCDDTIEPEMYETMLAEIKKLSADICLCQFRLKDNRDSIPRHVADRNYSGIYDDSYDMIRILYDSNSSVYKETLIQSVLNKLYKRDVIIPYRFEGKFGEDCKISNQIFSQRCRVCIIENELYNYWYTTNSSSLSHNIQDSQRLIMLDMLIERYSLYNDSELKSSAMKHYCELYMSYYKIIRMQPKKEKKYYHSHYREYLRRVLGSWNDVSLKKRLKLMGFYVTSSLYHYINAVKNSR